MENYFKIRNGVYAPIISGGTLYGDGSNLTGISGGSGTTDVTNLDKIGFNTGATIPTFKQGNLYWDATDNTLAIQLDADVSLQLGQEQFIKGINKTGVQINNGSLVYVSGAQGNRPTISLADYTTENASSKLIGMATENIPINTEGYVTTFGIVRSIDTRNFVAGDALYLSTGGTFINTKPEAPYHMVFIGYALNSTVNGMVFINPTNGNELEELHNVSITNVKDGDSLMYNSATTLWYNDSRLNNIIKYGNDYTGWYGNDTITETYDSVNRTVTLSGSSFALIHRGNIIVNCLTGGSWTSSAHNTGTTTSLFLKYNDAGFSWNTSVWSFDEGMVAMIANDGTSPIFGIREIHGLMDWETHQELHQTMGTYRVSGGDLSNYTLASTTLKQPYIASCVIKDEDISTTLAALNQTGYTQFYLSGGSGLTKFNLDQNQIVNQSGNQPYYNQYTGGVWTQTLMSNNNYQAIFLVGVPVMSDTTSQKYRYMWVQGQTQSATLATIQALTPSSLNLGTLPNISNEYVFLAKIIIRYSGGNWTITQVDTLSGSRYNQTSTPAGSYLSSVSVDGVTITGDGTTTNPLVATTAVSSNITNATNLYLWNNLL